MDTTYEIDALKRRVHHLEQSNEFKTQRMADLESQVQRMQGLLAEQIERTNRLMNIIGRVAQRLDVAELPQTAARETA